MNHMTPDELAAIREFYSGHFDHMPVRSTLGNIFKLLNEVDRLNAPRMSRTQRFDAQAVHIAEHQDAWDRLQGKNCDILGYLHTYGSYERWNLYQQICGDLQIEPRPEICHPNPED